MNQSKMIRLSIWGFISVFLLTALDQFTKYLAIVHLKGQEAIVLIDGVFQLRYLENRGAAFGILQGKKLFLIVLTTVLILFLCYLYLSMPLIKRYHYLRIILVIITAGAIGNLIDRVRYDFVVDFFYFNLINFPIFNVADIYVTLSAVSFFILFIFYYKEEDLDIILPSFKKQKLEK